MASRLTFDPTITPDERPGPSGGRRARNRAMRTQQLCEAALDCFTHRGIDGTRIDAIAREADISKSAFYRYFDNKTAIVEALFDALTERVVAILRRTQRQLVDAHEGRDVREAYEQMASGLVELFLAEPRIVCLFLQERHGAATEARRPVLHLNDRITELAKELTVTAQASGWVRPFNPDISTIAVLGAIYELLSRRLCQGTPDIDDLTAAEQLVDLVLHGVRTPETR